MYSIVSLKVFYISSKKFTRVVEDSFKEYIGVTKDRQGIWVSEDRRTLREWTTVRELSNKPTGTFTGGRKNILKWVLKFTASIIGSKKSKTGPLQVLVLIDSTLRKKSYTTFFLPLYSREKVSTTYVVRFLIQSPNVLFLLKSKNFQSVKKNSRFSLFYICYTTRKIFDLRSFIL